MQLSFGFMRILFFLLICFCGIKISLRCKYT